jgi:3-deoxy-manno-octulosonate cytidylyltransferase (CMP-KDO synthetase)
VFVIPARMRSARLPGKPLADIAGKPMIVRVWERATAAALGPVLVATDSADIAAAIERIGGAVVITRGDHVSGSDRVAEAIGRFDRERRFDIVVNLQGDQPEIDTAAIGAALAPLSDPAVTIATLAAPFADPAEREDFNVVKLVGTAGADGILRDVTFTRDGAARLTSAAWHHIGVYAFRRDALERFVALPPSPLEQRERLEQMRAIEAGMRIDAALVEQAWGGIDTPADLAATRRRFGHKGS